MKPTIRQRLALAVLLAATAASCGSTRSTQQLDERAVERAVWEMKVSEIDSSLTWTAERELPSGPVLVAPEFERVAFAD